MFHYRVAILYAKSFLLQSLVTLMNTVYIPYLLQIGAILVNEQLDAQLLDFIIRLLQSSTCFEQRHAHHQEVKLY